MDGVDLIFHEAGHAIFRIFGNEFLMIMGGTLMQLLVPVVFTLYFFIHGQRFSSSITGIWLSQSFFNVAVYERDAWAMELPLLGGENVTHDWNYIVTELDLIGQIKTLGNIIYGTGLTVLMISIAVGIYYSRDAEA
jgi:hypothetical protein